MIITALDTKPASAISNCKPKSMAKSKTKILVLGSSHGKGNRQWLQIAMGIEYNVASILKLSADLNSITGDTETV
jgi:hypothetical protein